MEALAAHLVVRGWVEEFGDYLFRCALKHMRERADAEDLVQETFLSAAQNFHQFKGESSPKTWLTSILRHKIIDRVRQSAARRTVSLDRKSEEELSTYFDGNEHWKISSVAPREWRISPEQVYEQRQFIAVVQDCLGRMPEHIRRIFVFREMEELSREEICNVTGLSSTNVGVILHRARLVLRNCVQTKWLSPDDYL